MFPRRHFLTYGYILCALSAASCSSIPVDGLPQTQEEEIPGIAGGAQSMPGSEGEPWSGTADVHIVQSGDTLWSIAWRYRLDVRDLAVWNRLANPDLILVGQTLVLGPNQAAPSEAIEVGAGSPNADPPAAASPGWQWPVQGPVVRAYGDSSGTGSGIDIGGEVGADVRAAAAGTVVYAGDGLAAYGNLVIIHHDETYLSAYGNNDEIVVAEGNTVDRGQVIARMGLGTERRPQVHFEIRRNGVPVDPVRLLPKQ